MNVALFAWAARGDRPLAEAMSVTFASLVVIQFFKAYAFRSDRVSVLHRPFANRWLNLAICWELALLLAIIYLPFLQRLFATFPLTGADWLLVVVAAGTIVPALELTKWMGRRGWFGELD